MSPLPLHQQLYLTAHDEQGNAYIHLSSLSLGLAGAIVLDLLLSERMVVHEGLVWAHPDHATGDPLTTTVLQAIDHLEKHRSMLFWVRLISSDAYDRVSGGLISAGLLSRVTRRKMGVRKDVFVPSDPGATARILSNALHLYHGRTAGDPLTAALCGLIGVLGLERGLDSAQGTTNQVRKRLRQVADEHAPAAGPILDLVGDLLGEAAIAVSR